MKTYLATPSRSRAKRWRGILDAMDVDVHEVPRLDLLEKRLKTQEAALALVDSDFFDGPSRPLVAARKKCPKLVVLAFGGDDAFYGDGMTRAMNAGCADFINDGRRDEEIESRLVEHLKRAAGKEHPLLSPAGDLRVVRATREVALLAKGKWQVLPGLTPKEFDLLCVLLKEAGRALTREDLIGKVWGKRGGSVNPEALDKQVASLRRKLGAAGKSVVTVRGVGYRFA